MTGRILIVDDVATNRIVLKVKLAAASYDVVQATDLASASAAMVRQNPSLVILSDRMPGVDGFCRGLRNDMTTAFVGIVVLAAAGAAPGQRLAHLAAGADEVLQQPIAEAALLAQVRSLLRRCPARPEILPDSTYPGLAEAAPAFERTGRITLISADQAALVRMRRELGGRLRDQIAAVTPSAVFDSLRTSPVPDIFVLSCAGASVAALRLLADLRARPATQEAAVLVLGGSTETEFRIMALDLGATDVVEENCPLDELVLRIRARMRQKHEADRRRAAVERELKLAVTDPLTGLANRRAAFAGLAEIAASAAQSGRSFALMMLDIDRFKQVNDRYGHPAGDKVLTEVADRLSANLRDGDLVARIGGEEFLVVLPETPLVPARLAAERLRRVVQAEPVRLPSGEVIFVTLSIGLCLGRGEADSVEEALARADRALYDAKAQGRNTVNVGRSVA